MIEKVYVEFCIYFTYTADSEGKQGRLEVNPVIATNTNNNLI